MWENLKCQISLRNAEAAWEYKVCALSAFSVNGWRPIGAWIQRQCLHSISISEGFTMFHFFLLFELRVEMSIYELSLCRFFLRAFQAVAVHCAPCRTARALASCRLPSSWKLHPDAPQGKDMLSCAQRNPKESHALDKSTSLSMPVF